MKENEEKISRLARDVLTLDRNTLLVNLRFMDMALSRFTLLECKGIPMATDGQYLVYDPSHVLKVFKDEKNASVRAYLHVVMHCVYRHMYIHSLIDENLWNLACDIAVEKTINDLGLKSTEVSKAMRQATVLSRLSKDLNIITAQKLYYYFLDQKLTEKQITEWSELFRSDDHTLWQMGEAEKKAFLGISESESNGEEDSGDALLSKVTRKANEVGVEVVEHLLTADPLRDMHFIVNQTRADLVVIHAHGANNNRFVSFEENDVSDTQIGSVSERLLRNSEVPVMLVK